MTLLGFDAAPVGFGVNKLLEHLGGGVGHEVPLLRYSISLGLAWSGTNCGTVPTLLAKIESSPYQNKQALLLFNGSSSSLPQKQHHTRCHAVTPEHQHGFDGVVGTKLLAKS